MHFLADQKENWETGTELSVRSCPATATDSVHRNKRSRAESGRQVSNLLSCGYCLVVSLKLKILSKHCTIHHIHHFGRTPDEEVKGLLCLTTSGSEFRHSGSTER